MSALPLCSPDFGFIRNTGSNLEKITAFLGEAFAVVKIGSTVRVVWAGCSLEADVGDCIIRNNGELKVLKYTPLKQKEAVWQQ